MKSIFTLLLISFVRLSATCQDFAEQKEICQEVIQQLEAGEFSQVYASFDSTMKASITVEKISEIWKSLATQCGNYLGAGSATAFETQGMQVVDTFMDFERIDLDLRLTFNDKLEIIGMYFLPAQK